MKRSHLLRSEVEPWGLEELVEALGRLGLRAGWLDLEGRADSPSPLAEAAGAGVLRAVSVGGGRVVSVKPVAGPTVLRDLLREHFAGCAVVVVRGEVEAPKLERAGNRWVLGERSFTSDELARALRKPELPGSSRKAGRPARPEADSEPA